MSCPICGDNSATTYRPFCSRRCADRDLARWLNGSYAVPSTAPEDMEEAADAFEEALSRDALLDDPTKLRH
ncbi:DNA gyrase inhibitor YacG [Pseudooceanicola aestuarii]|uniref:DNA gyrase inhibitor YacG n=1 Tax=Pseudooceanicola aestuarii TaxID=2697319 RepID=UPI0013D09EC1|nr:DNA gyrase inhibitor YacG [Pseudooceanicola aestuarii]